MRTRGIGTTKVLGQASWDTKRDKIKFDFGSIIIISAARKFNQAYSKPNVSVTVYHHEFCSTGRHITSVRISIT
jgi:hypothetical protein